MFEPAHKTLPPVDYVSMIRSLYAEPGVMLLGALASALTSATAGIEAQNNVLLAVAATFVLVGTVRYADMAAFARIQIADEDVEAAKTWEKRATFGAAAIAIIYGFWCFYSFIFVNTPFAELSAIAVSVSVLVGVAGRNFAIDRLVTVQLVLIGVPLTLGMLLDGAFHTALQSVVLIAFFLSIRKVAGSIRAILVRAVHGRLEASGLANQFDTALATMNHGLAMLDADGLIAVVNDRAESVFNSFAPGLWKGRSFAALIHVAVEQHNLPKRAAEQLTQMVSSHGDGKVILKLASERFNEVTVSSHQDRVVLLFEDITERVRADERINFMAHYDALTGLPNRAYFAQQVEADLARQGTEARDAMTTLMIVDIDDFKHVNDTAGHLVGDRLLVEAAERLKGVVGETSLLARLGGDEFIIYRSNNAGVRTAELDSSTILAAFKMPFQIMGESLPANISIGIVVSALGDDELDGMMTKADLALYKAKAGGKAQSQIFREEMDTAYRHRQQLKGDLKACIAAGELLSLAFQPLVDLQTRKVVACEALARWNHPTLGPIPPSEFIPIAEESGLISDITRWALKAATHECLNWPDEVSVSVNVSARDFRDDDVEGMVLAALRESGLEPHRLEIEVTESALIEERGTATKILSSLGARGVGIALDDFGTGYSSLSYLQALPFTKLKVDRSFVMDIVTNPRSLKLLSNVAQLGKDINLTVTAEGVETEEQLALIIANTKVDQIQGYLFGIPLPRREVGELIARMSQTAAQPKRKHG